MKASHFLDTIRTAFDEQQLVATAGLLLPATLMQRLGASDLLAEHVDLGGVPGAAQVGLKGSALVAALPVGAKWINDVAMLRAGETAKVLDNRVAAASTMGMFLPAFSWGACAPAGMWSAANCWRGRGGPAPGLGRIR